MNIEKAYVVLDVAPESDFEAVEEQYKKRVGELEKRAEELKKKKEKTAIRQEQKRIELAFDTIKKAEEKKSKKGSGLVAKLFLFLILIPLLSVGVYFAYTKWAEQQELQEKIATLVTESRKALGQDEWEQAGKLAGKILQLDDDNPEGLALLEEARAKQEEEIKQLVLQQKEAVEGALGEMKWEEAFKELENLRAIIPMTQNESELQKLCEGYTLEINVGKLKQKAAEQRSGEKLEDLVNTLNELIGLTQTEDEKVALVKERDEALGELKRKKEMALSLYDKALKLDEGTYSAEALEVLESAMQLYDSEDIKKLHDKFYAYPKTVTFSPDNESTIEELIEDLRPGDIVNLTEGIYEKGIVIPSHIRLIGAGRDATIIEGPASHGPIVTINGGDGESKPGLISSCTIRHIDISDEAERAPGIAVSNAKIHIKELLITNAAGHGLAIMGGSVVTVEKVEVKQSGWDGVSIMGQGSKATLKQVKSMGNYHHGIDVWDGAAATAQKCRTENNGFTGVLVSSPGVKSVFEECVISGNREAGVTVQNKSEVALEQCIIENNQMGGLYGKDAGTKVYLNKSKVTKNQVAGIVMEDGVVHDVGGGNQIMGNKGQNVWLSYGGKDKDARGTPSGPPASTSGEVSATAKKEEPPVESKPPRAIIVEE